MCGRLYDLGSGYPAAIISDDANDLIEGEVLFFDAGESFDVLLGRLDVYEGFEPSRPAASLFLRVRRTIAVAGGRELEAWVYVMSADREPQLVESGAIRLEGAWIPARR